MSDVSTAAGRRLDRIRRREESSQITDQPRTVLEATESTVSPVATSSAMISG